MQALKKEIGMTRDYLAGETIATIYFGGGTPSVFDPLALQEIIEMFPHPAAAAANDGGKVNPAGNREITLEINPDDVTPTFIERLRQTSFNRFSMGIQSFYDEDLVYLNRSHTALQAVYAVRLLQGAGYENLSVDLIYGIPSSSHERWQKNLEAVLSLDVPHISAYALTVEPKTPLAWKISKERSPRVSDELQVDHFKMLMEKIREQGYLQYEISNFCKPGQNALHNTNYWKGVPYLGLGPSAHSYIGNSRRWNRSNLSKYIEGITREECVYEEENLTVAQKYNEFVMTSLRTMWGCDGQKIISDFGWTIYDYFKKNILPLIGKGLIIEDSGVYFLTDEGKLFADRISSELFVTE